MSEYDRNRRTTAELYFLDPFVSDAEYGRFFEEATEMDEADAHNAEVMAYWEQLAAEEESGLA